MRLDNLRDRERRFSEILLEKLDRKFLKNFLFFSYLGARICYAETHPLNIFEEERFKDFERFRSFLLHLKRLGHYSVFAHSPVIVDLQDLSHSERFEIARTFFKVFWSEDGTLALFNLRHFAEILDDQAFLHLIADRFKPDQIKVLFARNFDVLFEGNLHELPPSLCEDKADVFAEQEVIIITIEEDIPFGWVGVITHNFSRIFSHQFVRHTWLNFNQRSHRYTRAEKFVVPSVFSEEDRRRYRSVIEETMKIYEELSRNMKKESARFVLPQGVATTVLATGPYLVWEDFINKRAIPQAQDEIRALAIFLKEKLTGFLGGIKYKK